MNWVRTFSYLLYVCLKTNTSSNLVDYQFETRVFDLMEGFGSFAL